MFDPDIAVGRITNLTINLSKLRKFRVWKPSEKLKILVVGYNGKRNTGSDARVESMVRQFYHLLGTENIEIGIITLDKQNSSPYFPPPTKQIEISPYFFAPLLKACSDYHMVVLSEGGCLKSNFSNSLLCFFSEAAGIMKKQGKPCVAYGVEAGHIDKKIFNVIKSNFDKTVFIGRTKPSVEKIKDFGYVAHLGTDTAWIFNPAPKDWAINELKSKLNWDGVQPLVGIAVINPFWWPVRPDIRRFLSGDAKKRPEYHYDKWYFMADSESRRRKFQTYISSIAQAVNRFSKDKQCKVAIFGMEALDLYPCEEFSKLLQPDCHVFSSRDYDTYQITAMLRSLTLLITSRYHAQVLSMPAGVPTIAISMDERLHNLMEEINCLDDYYLKTDDENLEEKLLNAMQTACTDTTVRGKILKSIPNYLQQMAQMGTDFRTIIRDQFPLFPLPKEPYNLKECLPPLNEEIQDLI